MHSFKKSIVVALSSLFLLTNVKAVTCGYEEKAKLNNEIANVKTNYEIKERILDKSEYSIPDSLVGTEYEENYVAKTDYISVNVLNLTENMYVDVTNDYDNAQKIYQYSDTTNGNLSFDWYEVKEIVTYTIKVYTSNTTGCSGELLKTLTVKLPRFNEYSDYSICENFPDYYLCQRYVTYEKVEFDSFASRMATEIEKKYQEENEEKENSKWYKKVGEFISKHKLVFITGGVVLISAAGIATFIIIKKRRRSVI